MPSTTPASTNPALRNRTASRVGCGLALLALAGYAWFLAAHLTVVAGGSDSSGYLNSARLLASGRLHGELRVPAEFGPVTTETRAHFTPAGFNHFPDRPHLAPVYPTGFPLHLALAARLFGWEAGPFLLQLGAALAAVWLCYRVGLGFGLSRPLAAAGAAILAVFPVFLFTSIQTLSDTLATTWTLAALGAGLRGRRSAIWAAACGLAFAVAVLVRPTNVLLAPALLALLGADWRRLGAFVAAGAPGAAWLLVYNHRLYGGALHSGYGNIYADFALGYAGPTALHYALWLARLLPAVLLVLPLAALLRPTGPRRDVLVLALAAVPGFTLYLFYGITHEAWWCLRFVLPALPALILLGLLGVESLARGPAARWSRAFRPAMAAVLSVWAAGSSAYWMRALHVLYVPTYERVYADAARELRARAPAGAVVICSLTSGSVYYYTDLPVLNFDFLPEGGFAPYAARARAAGRPFFALLFNTEENTALRQRCPGPWTRVATIGNIGLWKLP